MSNTWKCYYTNKNVMNTSFYREKAQCVVDMKKCKRHRGSDRETAPEANEATVQGWIRSPFMVKVKVKVCWGPHHEDVLGNWKYSSTHSLTSVQDGSEWSASLPGRFTPRERDPDTHWIGGWMGPEAGLDAAVKRKFPRPCRDSNLRSELCSDRSRAHVIFLTTQHVKLRVLNSAKWRCEAGSKQN